MELTASSERDPLFVTARADFHASLLASRVLTIDQNGIASNADKGSAASRAYASHIAQALKVEVGYARLAGQTSGGGFEQSCTDFLTATFPHLTHLRPGGWHIKKVGGRGESSGVASFEQYAHLVELTDAVKNNPSLRAVLGHGYAIAPDVVVYRDPVSDAEINSVSELVNDEVAIHSALRASTQPRPLLHAVVSCKWTLRSDRAQNARSEALNLIRNRKGRLPHIAVVTGEPTPTRISSLALGTGDIDCVYHFALPELVAAVSAEGTDDTIELLAMMIDGKRLKDIADLPLDLAV